MKHTYDIATMLVTSFLVSFLHKYWIEKFERQKLERRHVDHLWGSVTLQPGALNDLYCSLYRYLSIMNMSTR